MPWIQITKSSILQSFIRCCTSQLNPAQIIDKKSLTIVNTQAGNFPFCFRKRGHKNMRFNIIFYSYPMDHEDRDENNGVFWISYAGFKKEATFETMMSFG
jgi:hypothetical protein